MEEPSKCMNTAQAAEYLGKAEGTLRNWKQAGKGPKVTMIGGSVRYTKESLDEFVRSQ